MMATPELQHVLDMDARSPQSYDPNLVELRHQVRHGLDVTLFWDPTDDRTYIRVHQGASARLVECPRDRANECFEHPYGMLVAL